MVRQDFKLEPLDSFFQSEWNHLNHVPMYKWLGAERECDHYEDRMKLLGNLVVPPCALLGANMLHAASLRS